MCVFKGQGSKTKTSDLKKKTTMTTTKQSALEALISDTKNEP